VFKEVFKYLFELEYLNTVKTKYLCRVFSICFFKILH